MREIKILLFILLLLSLSACKEKVNIYELNVEEENITIYIGDSYHPKYQASINGQNAELEIILTSSAPNKVSVSDGVITGLMEGTAVIMLSLKDDRSIVKNISVSVLNPLVITSTNSICYLGTSLQVNVDDLRTNKRLDNLVWTSSNEDVASINNDGLLNPKKIGETTITVINEEGLSCQIQISVEKPLLQSLEIQANPELSTLSILDELTLIVNEIPLFADKQITWTSSDPEIASISSSGLLKALAPGEVTITATSVSNPDIKATVTFEIIVDPLKLFRQFNVENVLNKTVTTYGASERTQSVYGSVSNYFFDELKIIEDIAPLTMTGGTGLVNTYVGKTATPAMLSEAEPKKFTRSGILHPDTTYITYHDTGNNTPGAGAVMHSAYLKGSANLTDRARSWHYTVDSNNIVQHIPDNEVTWQGDSYTSYAYSIGIETAVDFGSDLYATWQRTAKLIASLMLKYNIPFSNIKQHYDWNGKNCPQTLRRNNLYPLAMEMVKAEVLAAKYLTDYDISFVSLNPEYVNNQGRVIALPNTATKVAYAVLIKNENTTQGCVLYSILPGQDGSLVPALAGNASDLEQAALFDQAVANLNPNVSSTDEGEIKALRIAYNCLSEVQRSLTFALPLLESYELALHRLNSVFTPIIINQFLSTNNDVLSHGYIELYNHTNNDISLANYSLQINNGLSTEMLSFHHEAVIKAKSYFLIALQEGNNENAQLIPLPDAIYNISLGQNGFIALVNKQELITSAQDEKVIDFVGMGNSLVFEGIAPTNAIVQNKASIRKGLIDTNQNAYDFITTTPKPCNSKNEVINYQLSNDQIAALKVDFLILSLPNDLSLNDQTKVTNARSAYNALNSQAKAFIQMLHYLEECEDKIEDLIDPNYLAINQALRNTPRQITNDFILPTTGGVVWSYKAGQDQSYFNLETGKYLKISYQAKYITLIITNKTVSKEVTINFGVLKEGQTTLFYTGNVAPQAGGTTGAGGGTAIEQANKVGFSGIALVVDNKALFVAEKSYIPLTAPESGFTLTKEALRPYGSSADTSATYNQSLVRGVATAYAGAGTLYENTSNSELFFDPSNTYGRNNSGAYGYAKVVFSPNSDGTYTIKQAWDNSGDNTSTTGTLKSLKPGELLWCPHTYETNANYGTWFMQPGSATNGTPVLVVGKILEKISFKTNFN